VTHLERIKATFEAKREAEREWEKYADVLVPSEESRHAALIVGRARNRMVGILTDDTIAALIAAVEAADGLAFEAQLHIACGTEGKRSRECKQLSCYPLCVTLGKMRAAIAPLVKGADDD
jgi:hypothetical protein